jgi:hypothetical protein
MSGAARALHWRNQRALPASKGAGKPLKILRDRDRELQLFPLNEEFPVSVSHQLALITSLPFVHTARRCPGLSRFEKREDCCAEAFGFLHDGNRLNRSGLNRAKVVTRSA